MKTDLRLGGKMDKIEKKITMCNMETCSLSVHEVLGTNGYIDRISA